MKGLKDVQPTISLLAFAVGVLLGSSAEADESHRGSPEGVDAVAPYRISVLTFEPGNDLFAAFGHTALVVDYGASGQSKVYNFGTFNLEQGSAKWRYMQGDLSYWLSVSTLSSTLKRYRQFGRGGTVQTLDLTAARASWLAKTLESLTDPSRRHYQYRHFDNNCCIKVRDLVDEATEGRLRAIFQRQRAGRSYREWTRSLMAPHPFLALLVDFVLGPAADRPINRYQEEFIPAVFAEDLAAATHQDRRPLVIQSEPVRPTGPAPEVHNLQQALYALGALALVFLGSVVFAAASPRRRASRRWLGSALVIYGVSLGLLGALLAFFQFTTHRFTHGNENHLLTPISHLWLAVPGAWLLVRQELGPRLRRATGVYLWGALALIGCDLLWKEIADVPQDNLRFLLPVAAASVLLLTAWRRVLPRGG